ncbi:MAG: hypothetical protein SVT52_02220 [Planctomycetota bacterium]|nr:hypothetical protein [Planctomycetota bacterium]
MRSIWAVTRYTFAQCLRMKVAGLFIVLLAVALSAMPFMMKGDGTLAGRIRTFLAYSTSVVNLLLSLVTVFLAVAVVSDDVRKKQIFTVVTKPLARWQYIIGRWCGVVLLNVVLLAIAATVIYAVAQYLRSGETLNANDRRAVETEIFTARDRISPTPFDTAPFVKRRIDRLKEQGQYEPAVETYMAQKRLNHQQAQAQLAAEINKQITEQMQSAGPGRSLRWRFSGVDTTGSETYGKGELLNVNHKARLARIRTEAAVLGRLVFDGPVRISGMDGRVRRLADSSFDVLFSQEDALRGGFAKFTPGRKVDIVVDPTIQIVYKASPATRLPDSIVRSAWHVWNPTTGLYYQDSRTDSSKIPATLTVSARLVDQAGRTEVRFINLTRASVTILNDDVAVLYQIGGFEWNFIRGVLMILFNLIFLAALGVFAGSFLSFSVGCLLVLCGLLPFAVAREFLIDAVKLRAGSDAMVWLGHYTVKIMAVLLPDLGRMSPANTLVDGMNIAWATVGEAAAVSIGVRAMLILAAGCWIFHRRELARVQI